MRFELTTLTLARLCSTPELRPHPLGVGYLAPSLHHRKRVFGSFVKSFGFIFK
jgi:hypothetical protein